jgi:hypothetical protein
MKRKVKKYAGDEGSLVKGSTNLRTRSDAEFDEDSKFGGYGRFMPKTKSTSSAKEDRPTSSGTEDYASMGKRAGATSTWSGAPTIKEETTTETETESPKGIASGFKSGESKFERDDNEVKMPAVKKKVVAKTESKRGNQSFPLKDENRGSQSFPIGEGSKTLPGKPFDKEEKPQNLPGKTDAKKEYYRDFSGKIKEKTPDSNPKKSFGDSISEGIKSFGSSLSDFASKNIKSPAQRRDEEKASKEKGFAKGGKVSTASSRGDGIAQRGKTKGRMC